MACGETRSSKECTVLWGGHSAPFAGHSAIFPVRPLQFQRFRSPLGSEEPDDLLLRHGDWLFFAVQTVVTSWLRTGTYINGYLHQL